MYEVTYGSRQGKKFQTLQDAVIFGRQKAKDVTAGNTVAIWADSAVVIGVITDDANGLTVHRLADWPEDEQCAY